MILVRKKYNVNFFEFWMVICNIWICTTLLFIIFFIILSFHQFINLSILFYQFINLSIHQFINSSIHQFLKCITTLSFPQFIIVFLLFFCITFYHFINFSHFLNFYFASSFMMHFSFSPKKVGRNGRCPTPGRGASSNFAPS